MAASVKQIIPRRIIAYFQARLTTTVNTIGPSVCLCRRQHSSRRQFLLIYHFSSLIIMPNRLEKVELQADVYMTCLQHALSTENFEVMGLLIGNIEEDIAKISSVIILRRLDKKKDRVEISDEQLLKATMEAEQLKIELKREIRVLGWYHSHPHITVFPSHVDIRTQATYQTMDAGFVGLIFSVFNEDKESKEQEVVLTCFQSRNGEAVEIPLEIISTNEIGQTCLNTMKELPKILVQEEEEMAERFENNPDLLAAIHNDAVRTRALAHITDIITKPLIEIFTQRLEVNKIRSCQLQKELLMLRKEYSDLQDEKVIEQKFQRIRLV